MRGPALWSVADKDTMRYGRYPKQVGNPHGGWNFAITRRRIVLLPFWDYKNSRMEFLKSSIALLQNRKMKP